MAKKMTAKQLANLKPAPKGNNLNPAGRKGKNGDGGYSMKADFKRWIKMNLDRDPNFMHYAYFGVYNAAGSKGDVKALEALMALNGEKLVEDDSNKIGSDNAPQIIINIPQMEDKVD